MLPTTSKQRRLSSPALVVISLCLCLMAVHLIYDNLGSFSSLLREGRWSAQTQTHAKDHFNHENEVALSSDYHPSFPASAFKSTLAEFQALSSLQTPPLATPPKTI